MVPGRCEVLSFNDKWDPFPAMRFNLFVPNACKKGFPLPSEPWRSFSGMHFYVNRPFKNIRSRAKRAANGGTPAKAAFQNPDETAKPHCSSEKPHKPSKKKQSVKGVL